NASESPKYWTQSGDVAPSRVMQKPVHPHNNQEVVITAADVATMTPEQVATMLTRDRELLAAVTSKLVSGKRLADYVFDTDTAKLPKTGPTDQALDAILENPTVAKKALKLTLTALGKGMKTLSSGKELADDLFGADTSHLISEEVPKESEEFPWNMFGREEKEKVMSDLPKTPQGPPPGVQGVGGGLGGLGGVAAPSEATTTTTTTQKKVQMLGIDMPDKVRMLGPADIPGVNQIPLVRDIRMPAQCSLEVTKWPENCFGDFAAQDDSQSLAERKARGAVGVCKFDSCHGETQARYQKGAGKDSLVGHSRVLGKNNVARRPVAHIVGDLPPKDTLLSLEQVRSLFAAAGTAMQHLLNLQDGLAGPAALELDASAAPELMAPGDTKKCRETLTGLWVSDPETWRGDLAERSEALPALAATPKLRALELFQRVSWAQLDLDLHSQKEAPSEQMLLELARRRLSSEQLAAVLPDFNEDVEGGLGSFRGPFSSGFALGEYVPLWKEVLAADLFEAFQGMDASEGQRFREALLAPGAGRAPLSAFRDFRRRGPKVAPLLTRL
ncbi:unnamed protein product, partial [Effrenium voratum]